MPCASSCVDRCRDRAVAGGGVAGAGPRQVSLNSDKQQSVRHLSPNCQGSKGHEAMAKRKAARRCQSRRRRPKTAAIRPQRRLRRAKRKLAKAVAEARLSQAGPRRRRHRLRPPGARRKATGRRRCHRPPRNARTPTARSRRGGRSTRRPDPALVARHGPPRLGRADRPGGDGRKAARASEACHRTSRAATSTSTSRTPTSPARSPGRRQSNARPGHRRRHRQGAGRRVPGQRGAEGSDKVVEARQAPWELDPASSEDYKERK